MMDYQNQNDNDNNDDDDDVLPVPHECTIVVESVIKCTLKMLSENDRTDVTLSWQLLLHHEMHTL